MPATADAHLAGRPGAGAVFLSYASEDADPAQRICAALRAAGIEVWFDRSELRGGDVWDATIRRQIKTCALFIPIISQNSHERSEGYFRLEWKLAVDRSHLMASDRAFLLPVVIDSTRNDDDRIPDRFRDVQWITLPQGETSTTFIELVSRLLAQPATARAAGEERPAPVPTATTAQQAPITMAAPGTPAALRRRLSAGKVAALIVAGVAVLGDASWVARRLLTHNATVVPYSLADRRMTFAVLPFSAPADDAHAQQVAKATAEAVTTELERSPLWAHVAPRRSVEQAVSRLTGAPAIARDLDVHFLIRGTVAKANSGNTVNLAVLDGATERVLATSSLTVPAEALVPRWRDDISEAQVHLVVAAMEAEVKAEADKPAEALDVRGLSFRAYTDWRQHRGAGAKQGYTAASDLLERALALAPDDPLATYLTSEINLCDCVLAWSTNFEEQKARGSAALEKYLRMEPNDSDALVSRAELFQLRGRWQESLAVLDAVLKREPENSDALATKAVSLLRLGRAQEALPIAEGLMARYPDKWPGVTALVADIRYALGDYAAAAPLAANAAARMSEFELKNPIDGTVRLTQAAAEAHLAHHEQATAAIADFNASVPSARTLTEIRKWMYPTADLYGFEPLFEGLRLAGVKD